MPNITIENPDALGKPLGQYSQLARVKASEFLFIAGQVATDRSGKVVGADDFDAQCRQVFANIEAALASRRAGASWAKCARACTADGMVEASVIRRWVRRFSLESSLPTVPFS